MPAVDLLTLGAVCTVVFLVSLPCLRDFAVRENERDACRLLPLLSQLVNRPVHAAAEIDLEELFENTPRLADGLSDAHPGEDGLTLLHHGYVFAVEEPGEDGRRAVLAWPWEHGRTGLRSFRFRPGTGLLEHRNPAGRWSGDRGPGPQDLVSGTGWAPTER